MYVNICVCVCMFFHCCVCGYRGLSIEARRGCLFPGSKAIGNCEPLDAWNQTWVFRKSSKYSELLNHLLSPSVNHFFLKSKNGTFVPGEMAWWVDLLLCKRENKLEDINPCKDACDCMCLEPQCSYSEVGGKGRGTPEPWGPASLKFWVANNMRPFLKQGERQCLTCKSVICPPHICLQSHTWRSTCLCVCVWQLEITVSQDSWSTDSFLYTILHSR